MNLISLLAGRNKHFSMTKYRFEVIYTPRFMQKAVSFIQELDVDIVGAGFHHVLEFSSSKDLAIDEVKKHLIAAYESDDCKVLRIEGGTVA